MCFQSAYPRELLYSIGIYSLCAYATRKADQRKHVKTLGRWTSGECQGASRSDHESYHLPISHPSDSKQAYALTYGYQKAEFFRDSGIAISPRSAETRARPNPIVFNNVEDTPQNLTRNPTNLPSAKSIIGLSYPFPPLSTHHWSLSPTSFRSCVGLCFHLHVLPWGVLCVD